MGSGGRQRQTSCFRSAAARRNGCHVAPTARMAPHRSAHALSRADRFTYQSPSLAAEALSLPRHLRQPPADAHKQKSPVLQKLRRLAFERVSDELKQPADDEESAGYPERQAQPDCERHKYQRQHDQRNAQCVAGAIERMLMAARVLPDPLVPGAVSHGELL